MLVQRNRAVSIAATSSISWRSQINRTQLVSQVSSILLQRQNWVSLLKNLNLSLNLTPSLFLQVLHKTETRPQISLSFFNWAKSDLKFKPNLPSQCHIIQLFVGSGLGQHVRSILDSLVQTHPASVLGEAMIQACRGKDYQNKVLSSVLECYSYMGLYVEGLEIFNKMRVNGYAPSVRACNSLLDLLQRENEVKLAWCFYGAMIRDGVGLDNLSSSLVARILCKDGNFERIVRLLDMGVYNSVMFNAVIDFYSKNGNFDAAFNKLDEMCDRKLDPGFSSYSSILDGACKHGNVEVIERVLSVMVEKGFLRKSLFSEYDVIIQKLCDLRRMDAVGMFIKRAYDEKVVLQDNTYRFMLKVLSNEGRVEEAIGLYRIMLGRGITMKDSTYHAFVDVLCNKHHHGENCDILKDIILGGFSPSTSSLSKFISSQCGKHRWKEAEELLHLVLEQGLVPDAPCCCSLVEHYCSSRQIEKAVALHNKMENLEGRLDVATYNILLKGLVRKGRVEEAIGVFNYMKRLELVNSTSFIIIIRGFCHAKDMRQAMKLHDEMLKLGLKPEKGAYKNLILGLSYRMHFISL